MGEDTEPDDSGIRKSVDSFRRAGSAASDGFRRLYGWGRTWFDRRHLSVQLVISLTFWFGGNWTYNRIAPPTITVVTGVAKRIVSVVDLELAASILRGNPIFAVVQVLLLLLVIVVAQNRAQTQKLKTVESKLTTMCSEPREATDGGTPEQRIPSNWTICGVICGAIVGISFGPGGVLAGIYLGFWIGTKFDYRAYERDPLTPDLKTESRTE